jgi:hypothetical protein
MDIPNTPFFFRIYYTPGGQIYKAIKKGKRPYTYLCESSYRGSDVYGKTIWVFSDEKIIIPIWAIKYIIVPTIVETNEKNRAITEGILNPKYKIMHMYDVGDSYMFSNEQIKKKTKTKIKTKINKTKINKTKINKTKINKTKINKTNKTKIKIETNTK